MIDTDTLRREADQPSEALRCDLQSVIDDLVAAFEGDLVFDWMLRADRYRDSGRQGFFSALIRHVAFGVARIDRPVSGGAAAVWLPANAVSPVSIFKEIQLAPAMVRATGWSRIPRLLALQAAINRQHPEGREHAYLWFLGVRPEARGLGVGSRLLRAASRRLDSTGMAAYLETQTERNVALYRRHGFEVVSEFRARHDAPPQWGMWREPRTDLD